MLNHKHIKITIEVDGEVAAIIEHDRDKNPNIASLEYRHIPTFLPITSVDKPFPEIYALSQEEFCFEVTYKEPIAL